MAEAELTQEKEKLQKQLSSAASWFYIIGALSLINTVIALSGSDWGFVIGLAMTQIMDAIAREVGTVGVIIALVFDLTIAATFVVFGFFAAKRHKWAFITGMVVYALDTLLILPAQIWLSFLFHLVALYYIFQGLQAGKKLEHLAPAQRPEANTVSGVITHE
jgi:hypothetical protein